MPDVGSKKAASTPKPAVKATPKLKIEHPEVVASLCVGEKALTAETAKDFLGYTEVPEDAMKAGLSADEPLFHLGDVPIWCTRNVKNRPLYDYWGLVQEILNRRWEFNGEPIIITDTGMIANGQHTLVALIVAQWIVDNDVEGTWTGWEDKGQSGYWKGKVVSIDKLVVFGIKDNDKVLNTMDLCKPRSIMDVIYRSPFFKDLPAEPRRQASRNSDLSMKMIWDRTGMKQDAWAPRRTHTEAVDFITNHPKLLDAINLIMTENKSKTITEHKIGEGYSAAMLYLMGTCKSDAETHKENQTEKVLDLSMWEKAEQFWKLFCNKKLDAFRMIRTAVARSMNPGESDGTNFGGHGTLVEKIGVIAKAWRAYLAGEKFTDKDLQLFYSKVDGIPELKEFPKFGGIDLGKKPEKEEGQQEEESLEAIKARAKDAEDKKKAMRNAVPPTTPTPAPVSPNTMLDEFTRLKKEHPDRILVMKSAAGGFSTWEEFADSIAKITGKKAETANGVKKLHITVAEWDKHEADIFKLGIVCLMQMERKHKDQPAQMYFTDLNAPEEPEVKEEKPTGAPAPKPVPKKPTPAPAGKNGAAPKPAPKPVPKKAPAKK